MNNVRVLSKSKRKKIILTACIGQCVHVAGTYNFINYAKQFGYDTIFLGPATSIKIIIDKIISIQPDIVGLSYRLTPNTIFSLFKEFFNEYAKIDTKPNRLFFAGTPEVVKLAKKIARFDQYFIGGETKDEIFSILRNNKKASIEKVRFPMDLLSRIRWKAPYPLIRVHFGLPSLKETSQGIEKLANAKVLDVISIAPDQNTQSNYFHPKNQQKSLDGAGGVPLRVRKDFELLDKARLTGNFPLLRIYAGTRDFIRLAKLYRNTINNAWAAIPVFWFNQIDGRGPLTLKEAIKKHLKAIKWHAGNHIPVEINDPHHWSLRDAPDAIAVADMYLCGIIAKKLGVRHFIAQYMFNNPPGSSFDMDLAKMLAKDELLQTLVNENFSLIRQVRTGLASFPLNLDKAKGQLAAATMIQLALNPDIVHVVSFSEADHAALPKDIIESCNIVDQLVNKFYSSNLSFINQQVRERKDELIRQAKWIINLIPYLAKTSDEKKNPWIDYRVLNRLVTLGIFDAPHLRNNPFAPGRISTRIINGACYSWDYYQNEILEESERIKKILVENDIKINELKQGQFKNTSGAIIE